ncbi:MAG: PAS domain S-box protein [Chloroflexi bacterium]|nr:PAS domain S-box protein [Chloroflexota bacterium]
MADDVAVRQPDGTLIPQLVNAGPLLDPSGEQMGGVVIFADITERKQAEQAIRENEEKFRTVADFTYDWEYWMGPDGQFVYVSPACERIMGYTREEFMEDPSLLERIAHPDDRHLVSTILNEWAASEENHAVEFRVITRDGEERWIGHASQAVYGEDGRFLGQRASNRDATESKLAEQEIQRSEREYRELNAGLRDGIVSVNLEGNTLSCNPAFEEMTGYSLKDAQERTLLDMTPEKWHAMEAKILEEQVLVRGYSDLYEKEVIRKDGTIFPIEMTAYLSRDEQGNPAGFWAYIHDITERKRAAQAIRENEERFRTVADFTYDWEYWMGPDGQFVYVSPSCERIMGYTREEFMEDPSLLERIAYPDDRHLVSTLLNEWVTSEEDHAVDFRVITRDGEERWIGHASQAVYGDDGAFLGQRASNRDITVEKQAEIEQEHFATELDQIFNSTAEGMRVVNENFDVLRANAAFVELSGMTQDQVLNTKCYKSLHGAVCHTPDCTLVRVLSGEDRLDEELEKERADGTRFPCQVMATPFKTPDGQVVGIVEVFRDITERKQVEEERERFTLQLGTAADIAGQVNAILDPDELLNTIIPLLKERFGLYYAHVFVLDEDAGELRLRAGYGEPGRAMLEQGLSIPLDREASLVARAARSKENVVVHDVTVAPDFMPNPLLPDTKSEVAVPMVVGDQVLGVFDVQHDQANYFTQADLDVFSTLAGQVATALQNAQLFEQQQRADAALQQRIIALTQPLADTGGLGFDDLFNVDEIQALQDAFAEATGVASIITDPEGVPITEASNFCKMCQMVRSTEQGQANCFKSDAELGKPHPDGLAMQPCLSGGLWDAGVSIFLGDAHIANWLIGQVLTDDTQVEQVIEYGKSLGLHEDEFSAAVDQVTRMPLEQFEQAGRALGALASQLSTMAQQNVQQARDITQRQQVEEIVRESEERFRTVADFTYDWEYWMGPDGQFIYVSPACERIMGYTREEFMEDPSLLERIAHPDDRHLVSTILNEWVMSEENHEVDFRVITRDDEERWISHASQAVYGDDGAFLGQRASNRDATESKRAEASVQESEERFRGVFENVMMGLYRSTPDGQIIMANPALVRMLGYSSFEELAQRDLEDDGFEEDQARSIFKERIENEGQIVQESVWTKLNGDALIVRESARAIRDETGNVLYYEGTVEDITERKRAEEELLRLSSAVEQTGDGIAVADLEGNILYVNPAWAQMHGYTVEEIQGKHLFMFYTEEQAKSEVMPFNEIVMQAGANSGEIGHVRKDGVIFPTLMTTTVLKDEAGNPVGLVGTARDITATKRLNMISRGLNAAGDEDEILQLLAESTAEAGALSASLQYIELDQTGEPEWLQMAATWQQEGESPAPVGTRFYIPEFPFSKLWLANPDEPLLVADVAVDERVDENVKAMLLGMHIAAFVVIPLAQAGQRIGLVTFEWPTAHEFTEQEVEIYQALISIVAPVVVNRRLLIAQERALTETLYRISSGLNTASDEDEILRALAQPAIDAQVGRVDLSYVELDAAGEPEWLVTAAVWQREGEIMFPAGTRYRLADLPFADLWLADPDKPQLIADVAKDEQLDETIRGLMEQAGSRAMAVVPLYQAGRWLGLLSLTWSKAHEFGEQEAEIYRALIGLGSPSVANRRAYLSEQIALAQTEDQAQRLAVLHEASQQLSQTENLDEIYKVVAIQTPRVVIAERASVALLRGAGDYLEVLALQGESGAIPVGMQLPIEETASGMAVQENRVVTISNTADSPLIDSQGIAKQGLNSTMCAPLVVGGRAVGTLNVGNLEPDAYTERDETMLLQMASLLASTIENRRLFEQTEALYQAGRRINEAEDLKEIMTAVVEAVPIPEINRAMLVMFDRDLDGDVAAMVVTSVWYSGVGTEPTPVGTRYPREIFKTVDVLLSPEPLFLNDVQHDERVIDPATQGVLKQQNIRTMAVLPLWAGMRQLGALLIEGEDVHYFADDERDRYTALARQMAAAVDARNLFQQTQDALAQTDALYSISRGLSAAVDVGEQLNVLAHIAMDAGMSTANLLYIDLNQANEPEWVEIVALWQREGKSPIPVGSRFYLPEFPLADLWIGSPDEAQIIANIASDERVDENARNLLAQSGTRALIIIPLAQSGRWVGIVTLGWAEAREFTDQDVMIYNALIGLASPAVAGRRLMDNLERIVSERTEQISTASDIAGQVNAILDPNELLNEVVSQLHERFGLYHVHAYLLDEPLHELLVQADPAEVARIMGQRELVIYAGSGEAGQVLLEQRHTIPLNREHSLVARAARTRKLVSVADTDLEPDFMPNPLLPETRSEVSVPLVIGDRVLGVLDVQDDQPNRFSQADLDVFSTLAGQIATALQNAGYVEQVEARLKVSQALAGTQTEDDVLDAMTQTAGFYPQARVSIYTLDPETDEYTIILRRENAFESGIVSPLAPGVRYVAAQYSLLQQVMTGNPLVSSNLPLDERLDSASLELVSEVGYTSAAFLPIIVADQHLGLVVATCREEGFFDERKLRLYQALAEQGGIALFAARLYEDTQKVAERLQEVNQVKSEFMADMSHELRTPLNSIIGYAELMLMGISDMDPDTLEDIQAIYDNGRHLLKLINDILDLSKIEAGRMELNIEQVYIDSLLNELRTTNAGLLVGKPIDVRVDVEADLPPIEADRVRISQIVNNLVGNAIKFTERGSITLRGHAGEQGWVCIEVEDTGVGMDEDDMREIFERYRQVGDVGARAKGTGLGLSITRYLVQMHGGVVDVRSEPGKGSIFTVRLPVEHTADGDGAGNGESGD